MPVRYTAAGDLQVDGYPEASIVAAGIRKRFGVAVDMQRTGNDWRVEVRIDCQFSDSDARRRIGGLEDRLRDFAPYLRVPAELKVCVDGEDRSLMLGSERSFREKRKRREGQDVREGESLLDADAQRSRAEYISSETPVSLEIERIDLANLGNARELALVMLGYELGRLGVQVVADPGHYAVRPAEPTDVAPFNDAVARTYFE